MTEWDGSSYLTASAWARDHWTDVQVPYRLHERGFDAGGAPEMSGAFLRFIQARATHTTVTELMDVCHHPRLRSMGTTWSRVCPDCDGTGYAAKRCEVYRYPMAAALHRLVNEPAMRPHQPTPAQTILLLSRHAWDLAGTSLSLHMAYEMFEALALLSLRKLHSRYAVRPIAKVGYVSMSEAQRNAEYGVLPS